MAQAGLHAIGLDPLQEALSLLADAAFLAGVAAVLGIGSGILYGLVNTLGPVLFSTRPPFVIDSDAVGFVLAVAAVVTVIGVVVPAIQARRLDVPRLLRVD